MTAARKIQEHFGCTALAASELLEKSRALSKALVTLRNAYHTDHLDEAIKLYNDRRNHVAKSRLDGWRKKYLTYRPSSACRTMLKAFVATQKAHESSRSVWRAHNLPDDLEAVITTLFELRHETHDLSNAYTVIEGRNAFDTINRSVNTSAMLSVLEIA